MIVETLQISYDTRYVVIYVVENIRTDCKEAVSLILTNAREIKALVDTSVMIVIPRNLFYQN